MNSVGVTRLLLLGPFYSIQTNFLYFFAHDCMCQHVWIIRFLPRQARKESNVPKLKVLLSFKGFTNYLKPCFFNLKYLKTSNNWKFASKSPTYTNSINTILHQSPPLLRNSVALVSALEILLFENTALIQAYFLPIIKPWCHE